MLTATQSGIKNKTLKIFSTETNNLYSITAFLACLFIAGCGGGGGGNGTGTINTQEVITLKGSVGDGPIVGATLTVKDANGDIVTTTTSNEAAAYELDVPGKTLFPVTITASGGTDIVSGTAPDFSMVTVALKKADLNSKKRTVNINPYSTFIVQMALSMNGGLNEQNVSTAKQTLFDTFSFGLDSSLIADPISSDINDTNIASIVKASESVGEMIRRTRDAIISSGTNVDGDYIVSKLANDLADGKFDANGNNTVSSVSATAKVVSAQVLIETLRNRLKVNGALATDLMNSAILTSRPSSSMTTNDVALTSKVIEQTTVALDAIKRFAPSSELTTLSSLVEGLSASVTVSEVNSTLSTNSESIITTAINLAPLATEEELDSINNDDTITPVIEAIAPVINSNPVLSATEGTTYQYDVNAGDANSGDNLVYILSKAPSGMSINASTGLISWSPDSNQTGAQNVTVTVMDDSPSALSASQSFSIAVASINIVPDNSAPVISSLAVLNAKEGSTYNYDVNASDTNGDTLSYSLTTAPSGMTINSLTGLINWVPTSSQVGSQDVVVNVSDNGSPVLSVNQGFSIAVTAANVAPSISSVAPTTAKQGVVYSYNVNATDSNNDSLTFSLTSAPTGMSINASSGVISWTPTSSQVGVQNVSVSVSDNGSPKLSDVQNFAVTVAPDNANIIRVNAGGASYTDASGQVWSADYGYNTGASNTKSDAIANTTDDTLYQSERWHSGWQDTTTPELEYSFDVPAGDYAIKLHFAEISKFVTRLFDVEIEGNLAIDNLDIVTDAGRYTALVKNIVATVNDGTLNIRFPRNAKSPKISAIEIYPVKNNQSASTTNGSSVNINSPEASSSTGTLAIISQPANGTASVSGSNINYTADANFGGQDTILYMFTDANGTITYSSITVTVTCNNCNKESQITLSWLANSESIVGYRVFYGPDAANTTELASDLTLVSGLIDPTAPSVKFAATSDLNFYSGEKICFKIQAYSETQNSDMSTATCGTI